MRFSHKAIDTTIKLKRQSRFAWEILFFLTIEMLFFRQVHTLNIHVIKWTCM